ncbi:MAG: hypothetical protein KC431_26435, partial [Myxococcales bacterium]|nr:hypothetical protein [Myxococcales bacterium]
LAKEKAEAGARLAAVDSLAEAARIVDERLDDPLSAMRVLLRGVALDHERDVVMPRLRELAARVDAQARDRGAHGGVEVGALVELRALGELVGLSKSVEDKIGLLEERAKIRESRLDDGAGALGEWLRILTLAPNHRGARDEAERLAARYDLWHRFMLLPAWELERTDNRGRQATLLAELADLYEHKLARPEYAFRARLEAWKRAPKLPPYGVAGGPLGEANVDLWRLAGVVGSYRGPALPKDPALTTAVPAPELHDRALWKQARLDPQHLTPPGSTDSAEGVVARYADPHAEGNPDELTAVAPPAAADSVVQEVSRIELIDDIIAVDSVVQEVSRVELVEDSIVELSRVEMVPTEASVVQEVSVVELLEDIADEFDEEDDEEEEDELTQTKTRGEIPTDIEEFNSAELESATVSGVIGQYADPRKVQREARQQGKVPGTTKPRPDPKLDFPTERVGSRKAKLPAPAPRQPPPGVEDAPHDNDFDLSRGLPVLPTLSGPVLPPRPSVAGAWDELANAYAELPTANKEQKVAVQLASARLWEEGAGSIERAFVCHERALLLIPERPDSVASLEALALRHDAR